MSSQVLYVKDDLVICITLNRPNMLNSISSPLVIQTLVDCVERMNVELTEKVVIPIGAGSTVWSCRNIIKVRKRSSAGRKRTSIS